MSDSRSGGKFQGLRVGGRSQEEIKRWMELYTFLVQHPKGKSWGSCKDAFGLSRILLISGERKLCTCIWLQRSGRGAYVFLTREFTSDNFAFSPSSLMTHSWCWVHRDTGKLWVILIHCKWHGILRKPLRTFKMHLLRLRKHSSDLNRFLMLLSAIYSSTSLPSHGNLEAC